MSEALDKLKTQLERLPKEKEITVFYKIKTLEQVMALLEKELQLSNWG